MLVIDKSGPDGNIFALVLKAASALRQDGNEEKAEELETKFAEAVKHPYTTYDSLVNLVERYISVEWL